MNRAVSVKTVSAGKIVCGIQDECRNHKPVHIPGNMGKGKVIFPIEEITSISRKLGDHWLLGFRSGDWL